MGESSPSRRSAGGWWRGVPWAPWLPPPRRDGRQLNPESGAQAGPSRLAPRAHCGPRRAGARACPTRRPGVRVTPSARLGSWRAATVCGGSARDRSAERRVWAAWPRRHLGPGDRCVQPAGGAFHPSWGVPRRSRPSTGRGAVRRACARRPRARWRPSRPSHAENRWGLFKLDAEVSAALWRAAAPWLPSHSSGPQLSSRKFQSHRNASIAAANR